MDGFFVTQTTREVVQFDSPTELFGEHAYTFIGACVEKGLVFMGKTHTNHLPINTNIPNEYLVNVCFDDSPRGEVLIVKTNDAGDVIAFNT